MKLAVLHTDYGKQRYYQYYVMENGKCLSASWSKQFNRLDNLEVTETIIKPYRDSETDVLECPKENQN